MSAVLTPRPKVVPELEYCGKQVGSTPEPAGQIKERIRIGREMEPLEEAVIACEQPEQLAHRHAEAPDAGRGGIDWNDRESRHGRSWG